jgi:hypothetical protein
MKIQALGGDNYSEREDDYSSASTEDKVREILDAVSDPDEVSEDSAPDLSDVELRLEEANCYKALLRNPLFDSSAGAIARRVERKIREYIRTELKILLGLETAKVMAPKPSDFSEDEIKALKMLSSRILNKPIVQEKPVPKEPTVNQAHVDPPKEIPAVESKPKKGPGRPAKVKTIEKIINLPNGEVKRVEIPVTSQVQPPEGTKRIPTPTPDEAATYNSRAAMVAPKGGLLGTLIQNAVATGTED